MRFRLAFLKRDPDGFVKADGFEVAADYDADFRPYVGEFVVLPDDLLAVIRANMPELAIQRRFEVVCVDHNWSGLHSVTVDISTIRPNPWG